MTRRLLLLLAIAGCGHHDDKPAPAPPPPPAAAIDRDALATKAWDEGNHLLIEVGDDASIKLAIERYRSAAALWRDDGNLDDAGMAIGRVGAAYNHLRDLDAAVTASQEALAIFRRTGNREREAMALDWCGTDLLALGRVDEAIARYRESLVLKRAIGDTTDVADALLGLGSAYVRADRWEEAIELLSQAAILFAATGHRRLEADAHGNLGGVYYNLGDAEHALAHHERALAIWRSQPGAPDHARDLSRTLQSIGAVRDDLLGDPAAGLAFYQQAVETLRRAGQDAALTLALVSVGRAQLHRGQPRLALVALDEALAGFRTVDNYGAEINASFHAAQAHRALGELEAAGAACDRAVALADEHQAAAFEARARTLRARLRAAAGHPVEARVDADAAVTTLEAVRGTIAGTELRASYLATRRGAYEVLADLDAAAGDAARAFATSERAHARALLETIGGAAHAPRLLDAAGTQALLDGDTALIEYLIGDERTWAWVVTRDAITAVALAPGPTLEPIARALIDAVTARNLGAPGERAAVRRRRIALADRAVGPAARAAAAALIDPLRAALGHRRLVVVADGVLHYLPFAALPDPAGEGPLGVEHELIEVPSASVLAELRARPPRPAGGAVAILADPIFAADDPRLGAAPAADARLGATPAAAADPRVARLQRLPFTAVEADAIAALAPGRAHAYLGADASTATLASPEVRAAGIVHLATHGAVDAARPEQSGLVLSAFDGAGQPRDAVLGAAAIERLGLAAELVVLSACESALGRRVVGEGLVGLVHAFFRAGTPRVIATLWSVEDRASALFMTALYRRLLVDNQAPAAALRAARAALAADPAHAAPYYWAGVVLYGDG